jgi:dTDP-4-dehydrorhamnose 3,5-epimerase-like enzyme
MNNLNLVKTLDFPQRGDERGELIVVEGAKDIPFAIKRLFYICGTKQGVVRGQHANRLTEFVLINVAGSSKVRVKDGCGNEAEFILNKPNTGMYIPKMVWKEMFDFSADSVLLVLASEQYDSQEYIRKYDEYIKLVEKENA